MKYDSEFLDVINVAAGELCLLESDIGCDTDSSRATFLPPEKMRDPNRRISNDECFIAGLCYWVKCDTARGD